MNYNMPNDASELEKTINYTFKNKSFLLCALSHSSYANECRARGEDKSSNERLEFLGDSVLSLTVSEHLFLSYPELPEGDLSKIRAATVCEDALCVFAKRIELGKYLFLGHGEERTHGRDRNSLLADAFESLIAAIYLDSGFESAKAFLLPFVTAEINQIIENGRTKDYKTLLQQIIQQEQGELLEYVIVAESGPAHRRVFTSEARLNSNVIGKGTGASKREAEQLAAKEALTLFGV